MDVRHDERERIATALEAVAREQEVWLNQNGLSFALYQDRGVTLTRIWTFREVADALRGRGVSMLNQHLEAVRPGTGAGPGTGAP